MAAERPDKKEKKDKKRSDDNGGVSKPKKDKKDKKEKKEKLAAVLDEKLQKDAAAAKPVAGDVDSDMDEDVAPAVVLPLERTVVPFAVPVADEKGMKKVYKTIRKGMSFSFLTSLCATMRPCLFLLGIISLFAGRTLFFKGSERKRKKKDISILFAMSATPEVSFL